MLVFPNLLKAETCMPFPQYHHATSSLSQIDKEKRKREDARERGIGTCLLKERAGDRSFRRSRIAATLFHTHLRKMGASFMSHKMGASFMRHLSAVDTNI